MANRHSTFYEDFKNILSLRGLYLKSLGEGRFLILSSIINSVPTKVLFVISEQPDKMVHGSHNGNIVQAIGYFKLSPLAEVANVDFLIMAFENNSKSTTEYIIVPTSELIRKTADMGGYRTVRKKMELVFWLMSDYSLYETTDISPEGEWYFMSRGPNGRRIDGTNRDSTEYLNDWDRIMKV